MVRPSLRLTVAALSLGVVACTADTTLPTEPFGEPTSFLVTFDTVPGDVFSAELNGTTFTSVGSFELLLPTGTYTVSGTLLGSRLRIGFGRRTAGGVRTGSIEPLEGPAPQTQGCSVSWLSPNPRRTQTFLLVFTVATSGSLCNE